MPNLLEMRGVSYRPPDTGEAILRDVDLCIGTGERIGITGPSGTGKSTLALLMTGLDSVLQEGALEGDIAWPGIRPNVALVMQNPEHQLFAETVYEEVSFGLTEGQRNTLPYYLNITGLHALRDAPVDSLSVGQKQRVVLASFLARQPDLLILDEPTNYLDPAGIRTLVEVLKRLPLTMVMIEHDVALLRQWADRMLFMDQGQIVGEATASARQPSVSAEDKSTSSGILTPAEGISTDRSYPGIKIRDSHALLCRVNELECRYRKEKPPVLSDITFSIRRGERIALMGMNGSGKSTLLKHLAGLMKPGAGSIEWSGEEDRGPASDVERAGLVYQNPDYQLFESTVLRECSFSLRLTGRKNGTAEARSRAWLQKTGINALADRIPFTLSMGEKRRLTIAGVLTMQHGLLLLDEPTVALDEDNLGMLRSTLAELSQKEDMAVLFSTHDLSFARSFATRFLFLADGGLAADVMTEDLTADLMKSYRLPWKDPYAQSATA